VAGVGKARKQTAEAALESARTTVLVIDDEESFHRVVAKYLEGYRTLRAYTGWQGLDLLAKHHVDIVLLDFLSRCMTGRDGAPAKD